TPTTANWRHESINMDPYIGQASVLVQFEGISDYGNNLFVDNVNVFFGPVGINEAIDNNSVGVFPNPSNGSVFVKVDFDKAENVTITFTNPLGEIVKTMDLTKV